MLSNDNDHRIVVNRFEKRFFWQLINLCSLQVEQLRKHHVQETYRFHDVEGAHKVHGVEGVDEV